MGRKIGIGVIGCGTIADIYMTNLTRHFDNVELLAVSDRFRESAERAALKFGVPKVCTTEELLADPAIEIVLNLTIPAVHAEINRQILLAGKHAYSEKPLALSFEEGEELVRLAKEKGLMCVSAPDTFLGAGLQESRALIESGAIGEPVGFTANFLCPGHELWHPNPGFYYKEGGGPMLDMGPYYVTALVYLLGSIRKISCYAAAGRPVRRVRGGEVKTEVPTTYAALLEFASGAIGTLTVSFDVWDTTLPLLEIYGTDGSLRCADPNYFDGPVRIYDGRQMTAALDASGAVYPAVFAVIDAEKPKCLRTARMEFPENEEPNANMRGFGVADMAQALIDGRESRLSAELSLHVTEALMAFDKSARSGEAYYMKTCTKTTAPMEKGLKLWEVK